MTDIRTPDDEVTRPGYYYPPFREGWWYQGQTYAGHSDGSVDWNRRTKTGGWLDDTGDPVFAAAEGHVAEVDPAEGLVLLNHWGGLYRTEYRHMTGPFPKVGEKVERGERVGSIGNVAGDGRSFGAHLHHRHWRRSSLADPWSPVRMRFYDKPVEASVTDSDGKPASWKPPEPVMFQGPPGRATWESAAKDAIKALTKAEEKVDALALRNRAQAEELVTVKADLAACRTATPVDCAELEARVASLESRLSRIKSITEESA